MAQLSAAERPPGALRRALVPLALAQFICSFAGSNMNVMINDISKDLDTTVQGVQIAITVFLLVMAARRSCADSRSCPRMAGRRNAGTRARSS